MNDHIVRLFAAENGLDFKKLKLDYDYRTEHYSKLFKYTIQYKKANPNWALDALDVMYSLLKENASEDASVRKAFVIDDITNKTQLQYLQNIIESGKIKGLELIPIKLVADDETRQARGYRPPKVAPVDPLENAVEWRFVYENNGNDSDAVMKLDLFLADTLVRELAK